jgi:hypothetical protein
MGRSEDYKEVRTAQVGKVSRKDWEETPKTKTPKQKKRVFHPRKSRAIVFHSRRLSFLKDSPLNKRYFSTFDPTHCLAAMREKDLQDIIGCTG